MQTRHMYYYDSKTLDLAVFKADAYRHTRGDDRNPPQRVVIHYHYTHEHPLPEFTTCPDVEYPHEVYWYSFDEDAVFCFRTETGGPSDGFSKAIGLDLPDLTPPNGKLTRLDGN